MVAFHIIKNRNPNRKKNTDPQVAYMAFRVRYNDTLPSGEELEKRREADAGFDGGDDHSTARA